MATSASVQTAHSALRELMTGLGDKQIAKIIARVNAIHAELRSTPAAQLDGAAKAHGAELADLYDACADLGSQLAERFETTTLAVQAHQTAAVAAEAAAVVATAAAGAAAKAAVKAAAKAAAKASNSPTGKRKWGKAHLQQQQQLAAAAAAEAAAAAAAPSTGPPPPPPPPQQQQQSSFQGGGKKSKKGGKGGGAASSSAAAAAVPVTAVAAADAASAVAPLAGTKGVPPPRLYEWVGSAASAAGRGGRPALALGAQVAAKIARSHNMWILATVAKVGGAGRSVSYEVVDADQPAAGAGIASNHTVPGDSVLPLPAATKDGTKLAYGWQPAPKHSTVMALYPGTTSFYAAAVVSSSKQVRPPSPSVSLLASPCAHFCRPAPAMLLVDDDGAVRGRRRRDYRTAPRPPDSQPPLHPVESLARIK
jgi:hypothetical protein